MVGRLYGDAMKGLESKQKNTAKTTICLKATKSYQTSQGRKSKRRCEMAKKKRTTKKTVAKKKTTTRKRSSGSGFDYNEALKDTFGVIVLAKVIDKI